MLKINRSELEKIFSIDTLYRQIEEHATEYAERRAELLEMKLEAESAGRTFYQPSAEELAKVNEVIAQDEDQELLLTALAYGYIRPVLGQDVLTN